MTEFAIRTAGSDVVVISAEGRINTTSAPALRDRIHDVVTAGRTRVVIDLGSADFIDSSGLGALISGLKQARRAGGDLRIARPTLQVVTVLQLTNLNHLLRSYDSADRAFDD